MLSGGPLRPAAVPWEHSERVPWLQQQIPHLQGAEDKMVRDHRRCWRTGACVCEGGDSRGRMVPGGLSTKPEHQKSHSRATPGQC